MANSNQAKKPNQSSYDNFNNQNWGWGKSAPVDFESLKDSARKNYEAYTDVCKEYMDGVQAMWSGVARTAQHNAQQIYNCAKEACNSSSPQDAQSRHVHCLSNIVQETCNTIRDNSEIASKAGKRIVDVVSKRAEESTHEMTNCCAKSRKNAE